MSHIAADESAVDAPRSAALLARVRAALCDRHDVTIVLGEGRSGIVFAGVDRLANRPVAVKAMPPDSGTDPARVARWLAAAEAMARLATPRVVAVQEVHDDPAIPLFTMPLVAGASVAALHDPAAPWDVDTVRWIAVRTADALAALHAAGIAHGDLSLRALLVDARGDVVVTDAGLVRALDDAGDGDDAWDGDGVADDAADAIGDDQRALGVVAHTLLVGVAPAARAGERTTRRAILEARPDCPPALAGAIAQLLDPRPDGRWPSIAAAREALRGTLPRDGGAAREALALRARAHHAAHVAPLVRAAVSPRVAALRDALRDVDRDAPPTHDDRDASDDGAPSRFVLLDDGALSPLVVPASADGGVEPTAGVGAPGASRARPAFEWPRVTMLRIPVRRVALPRLSRRLLAGAAAIPLVAIGARALATHGDALAAALRRTASRAAAAPVASTRAAAVDAPPVAVVPAPAASDTSPLPTVATETAATDVAEPNVVAPNVVPPPPAAIVATPPVAPPDAASSLRADSAAARTRGARRRATEAAAASAAAPSAASRRRTAEERERLDSIAREARRLADEERDRQLMLAEERARQDRARQRAAVAAVQSPPVAAPSTLAPTRSTPTGSRADAPRVAETPPPAPPRATPAQTPATTPAGAASSVRRARATLAAPNRTELRAEADRAAARARLVAQYPDFFADGDDHTTAIARTPDVSFAAGLEMRADFDVRLAKYDAAGRRIQRVATVTLELVRDDDGELSSAVSYGPLRRP